MSEPYTPTTEVIRGRYVIYENFNSYGMDDSEETAKGFDRWLAQVEATAEQRGAERGWDEGYKSGLDTGLIIGEITHGIMPGPIPGPEANPYRADRLEGDDE